MSRKVTRLYTGQDGESHFEDVEIPLESKVHGGLQSDLIYATGIIFRETGSNYDAEWRNAPRRQFLIGLEGVLEIEVGDGTKRRFSPGDVLLAEDTTGRGHIARSVNNQPRKAIIVALA